MLLRFWHYKDRDNGNLPKHGSAFARPPSSDNKTQFGHIRVYIIFTMLRTHIRVNDSVISFELNAFLTFQLFSLLFSPLAQTLLAMPTMPFLPCPALPSSLALSQASNLTHPVHQDTNQIQPTQPETKILNPSQWSGLPCVLCIKDMVSRLIRRG